MVGGFNGRIAEHPKSKGNCTAIRGVKSTIYRIVGHSRTMMISIANKAPPPPPPHAQCCFTRIQFLMAKADYVEALSHNSGSMLGPLNLLVLQVDIYRLWKSYALDLLEIDCCCGGRVDIFRGTFSPPLPTIILPRNSRSPLFTSVFISWRKLLTFLLIRQGP